MQIRNTRQTVILLLMGLVLVSLSVWIHFMMAVAGEGVLGKLFAVISAVAIWIIYRFVSCCRIEVGDGVFVVRGIFVDNAIPFGNVHSVHSDDGVYFLLDSGRRVRSAAFPPSVLGEMRRYVGYEWVVHEIRGALSGWEFGCSREVLGPVRKIRFSPVFLIVSLASYFGLFLLLDILF